MSTPDVPIRLEFSVEVPGTPEQVWDAIATANGITAWMMRTELEEREGGRVVFHMGEDMSSPGTVTGWDPPRRLVYSEPEWAKLGGHDPATVTPLVSEFLVEATSGGSCVVRVVSSAFGSGADWEQEFVQEMAQGWIPMFDHLRLYLAHFPGEVATTMDIDVKKAGDAEQVMAAVRAALGVESVGQTVQVRGHKAQVERVDGLLLRLSDPVGGLLAFFPWPGDGDCTLRLAAYLYGPDAPAYAEQERAAWQEWLAGIG
jgi:uncharacterized protein YndB with AHSA1/START domain